MDGVENVSSSESEGVESLTVEEALSNLRGSDHGLRYYAAWWLGRFRVKESEAIELLIEVLQERSPQVELGDYSLQRNAARALGKLEDQRAVPALIGCLKCPDFYVREAAIQALEMLGNPSSIPDLMKFLEGGVEKAVMMSGKPHLVEPYEAIIEALGTLHATEAIPLILPFLSHPLERVQYATCRAMYQLTQDPIYGEKLVAALDGKELQLRRSALIDLGCSGYLPGAEAIAKTLAENSLKLIALKGLLEYDLAKSVPLSLSPDAVKIMSLMDSLL